MKKIIFRLISQLFTDYMNATTSNTEGVNDLTPEMKTYYDLKLIDLAEPLLVHDQFGQKRPIPAGNGKTINFRKFSQLPKAVGALTEGVTPDGQALNVTALTASVAQYGGFVKLTDLLELTAVDPVITEAIQLIGSQAGRSLDTITRDIITAGTNVMYSGAQSARNTLGKTHLLTVDDIRKAVRTLENQNAPKIDGYYVGIIHPDMAYDLMSDSSWKDWNKYTTPEKMYANEIGEIAGVRFVKTTEAKIFEGAGAAISAAEGETKHYDVYATMIIGEGAYGVTEVTGGGLETIIKDKAQAGGPLNQYSTVGWKATKVAKRLVEEYMVRIESGCSFGTNHTAPAAS